MRTVSNYAQPQAVVRETPSIHMIEKQNLPSPRRVGFHPGVGLELAPVVPDSPEDADRSVKAVKAAFPRKYGRIFPVLESRDRLRKLVAHDEIRVVPIDLTLRDVRLQRSIPDAFARFSIGSIDRCADRSSKLHASQQLSIQGVVVQVRCEPSFAFSLITPRKAPSVVDFNIVPLLFGGSWAVVETVRLGRKQWIGPSPFGGAITQLCYGYRCGWLREDFTQIKNAGFTGIRHTKHGRIGEA